MIIGAFWLSHIYILTNAFYAHSLSPLSLVSHMSYVISCTSSCPHCPQFPVPPKYKPSRFESTSKILGLSDPKSRPKWSLDDPGTEKENRWQQRWRQIGQIKLGEFACNRGRACPVVVRTDLRSHAFTVLTEHQPLKPPNWRGQC